MQIKIMKNHFSIALILMPFFVVFGQINPQNIEIIRDAYGVPHIYAKTDAEVAYGLAWAHAEDDFETIQLGFLAGDAKLSKTIGLKRGSRRFFTAIHSSRKNSKRTSTHAFRRLYASS
jgi:Protein related to penicillin acylase